MTVFRIAFYAMWLIATSALAAPPVDSAHADDALGVTYESVFTAYQRFDDVPLVSWHEVNETIGQVPTHTHVEKQKGSGRPESVTNTPPMSPAMDMENDHGH